MVFLRKKNRRKDVCGGFSLILELSLSSLYEALAVEAALLAADSAALTAEDAALSTADAALPAAVSALLSAAAAVLLAAAAVDSAFLPPQALRENIITAHKLTTSIFFMTP